ncbi:MAG: hypothetical protein K9I85_03865 [Saprospiraceae bacterium]|nr:hypothetical protein [Saprospiraceae bacterium]
MADYRLVILLFLTSWISADGQTRYVQTNGRVDTTLMIHDLRQLVSQDSTLQRLRRDILIELTTAKINHPEISASEEKKAFVSSIIHQLANGKGSFSFLYKKRERKLSARELRELSDTLTLEVIALQKLLSRLEDSMANLQARLIQIIESPHPSRATKEEATILLTKIPKLEVIDYIFRNQDSLRFCGDWEAYSSGDAIFPGFPRTGMAHLLHSYLPNGSGKKRRNWSVFPYMIEYLDEYPAETFLPYDELENFILTYSFLKDYKTPSLIYEFMLTNMDKPDSPGGHMLRELILEEEGKKKEEGERSDQK